MRIVEIYEFDQTAQKLELPLYDSKVQAGFPSPADDYIDLKLDLHEYLIKRPSATFFVKVAGDSMIKAGIHDGDILIVDRSLEPIEGKIVIAVVDGECTVKRIHYKGSKLYLMPENDSYQPIIINNFNHSFDIWGVVTSVIHPL